MIRFIAAALASVVALSGCALGAPTSETETVTGFVFVDSDGSHICQTLLESYPPQCGDPSVDLLDLQPDSVVALMSPNDPTLAPVQWTDYPATVSGATHEAGLLQVEVVDPVHEAFSAGLILRVADLGMPVEDPVTWPFDFTNRTANDVVLTFTDGQRVEVTLSDDSGEVYRWSNGMFFSQAIEETTLAAGASLPFVLRGEPTGLPAGNYFAKAWITAPEVSDIVLTWPVVLWTEG